LPDGIDHRSHTEDVRRDQRCHERGIVWHGGQVYHNLHPSNCLGDSVTITDIARNKSARQSCRKKNR
jgi:hypothetical protein